MPRWTTPLVTAVAITDELGTLIERITYDTYGRARHHFAGDVDGDGDVSTGDQSTISTLNNTYITSASYNVDADVDRNGTVQTAYDTPSVTALLPLGDLSDGAVDNVIGFTGGVFEQTRHLYPMRHRWYDADLGRFLQRDPAGYVDGMSLYEYGMSSPAMYVDPMGLNTFDSVSAAQAQRDWAIIQRAKQGIISFEVASALINASGHATQATIYGADARRAQTQMVQMRGAPRVAFGAGEVAFGSPINPANKIPLTPPSAFDLYDVVEQPDEEHQ